MVFESNNIVFRLKIDGLYVLRVHFTAYEIVNDVKYVFQFSNTSTYSQCCPVQMYKRLDEARLPAWIIYCTKNMNERLLTWIACVFFDKQKLAYTVSNWS